MSVRRNPLADALFFERYNENHDPSNGQFSDGGGSSGGGTSAGASNGGSSSQTKASGSGSGGGGKAGSGSVQQAQAAATTAAAGHAKLSGLPDKPIKLGTDYYVPGPIAKVHETAVKYMKSAGREYNPPDAYVKVDPDRATRVANAFDAMKHDPDDPQVKASYEALAAETIAQWKAVKESGLKVEWIKPDQADPYADSPRRAAMDVSHNNHWWGFPTDQGFGNDSEEAKEAAKTNPMLTMTDEVIDGRKCCVNDLFRIVHDYFGHFKDGVGFRADGEDNAWRSHVTMFSDAAKGAMTTETRGQNSWVNFGPYGESNKTAKSAETHFAPQKVGLLPEWVWKGDAKDGARFYGHPADLVFRYNENHDPDNGQFAESDGGGSGGGSAEPTAAPVAAAAPASSKAEPALHPDTVNVSGDGWNKETAQRLETDYQNAKVDIDAIVKNGIGDDVETDEDHDDDDDQPYVPEEWDMLSGDQQEQAKSHYIENNKESYIDSEIQNWHDNGDALDQEKSSLANEFGQSSSPIWYDDAIEELRAERDKNGEPPIPYTDDQLYDAISVSYQDGYEGKGKFEVEFDDTKLGKPSDFDPPFTKDQIALPGIDAPAAKEPHEALTDDMRDAITEAVKSAFDDAAEKAAESADPPDYLADSAVEYLDDSWDQMDDSDKFEFVKNNTDIVSDAEKEAEQWHEDHGGASGEVPDPSTFKVDPLNDNGGGDYKATQRLATYVSFARQKQLIDIRGLKDLDIDNPLNNDVDDESIKRIDRQLWTEWKNSSTSFGGQVLQLATADELGGRYRDLPTHKTDLIKQANDKYAAIGGYDGVKALVRAKWETTQYLLEKAGVNHVEVYRGMKVNLPADEKTETVTANMGQYDSKFERIPDMKLMRNGAWSTTTKASVANNWNAGSGDKIVMRIDAPRTAVLSVPAYGINVHAEQELVLAGTSYKNWDAWKSAAPPFSAVPIETPKQTEARSVGKKPFVVDLSEEDGKPHWLSEAGGYNPNHRQDEIRKKNRAAHLARIKAEKANGENE